MKSFVYILIVIISTTFLSSCKPDKLEIEIYTSDLLSAKAGEITNAQAKIEFSMPGEDEEGLLPKVVAIVKKYIPKDSEINQTKSTFGKKLTVNTVIPVGNEEKVKEYLKANPSLVYLSVKKNNVVLSQHKGTIKSLNREIGDINMMLSLGFPSDKTVFRVVSDQKEPVTISAIAVFSENKPFLILDKEIKRRKNIELLYKGGSGSVYKEIQPQFKISSNEANELKNQQNAKLSTPKTKVDNSSDSHPLVSFDRNQLEKEISNWGANKSEDSFVELLTLSENNDNKIKNKIAEIYYIGARPMTWGTAKKLVQVFKSIGDYNAEAQYNLGTMHETGQGVKSRKENQLEMDQEAQKWYRLAADQGVKG